MKFLFYICVNINSFSMATYTITINERTNSGKKLMDYLKSIDGVEVKRAKTSN